MSELIIAIACLGALAVSFWALRRRPKYARTPQALLLPKSFHKVLFDSRSEVLEDLRQLYQKTDHDVSVGLALGTLLRKEGQLKTALKLHQSLLTRPNLDDRVRAYILAEWSADFLAAGLLDRARQTLEEAIEVAQPDTQFCQHAARVYCQLREWDRAFDAVDRFFLGTQAAKKEQLAQIRNEQGEAFWKDEHYGQAKTAFEKAIAVDERCVPAYLNLSQYYRITDKPQKALRFLTKHQKKFDAYHWLWIKEMRKIATQIGDASLFLDPADDRLEDVPDDWRTRSILARSLMQQGDFDSAFSHLMRCLEHAPEVLIIHQMIWELIQRTPQPSAPMAQYMDTVRENLVFRNPYQCIRCGFDSAHLLWRCPSCSHTRTFFERKI